MHGHSYRPPGFSVRHPWRLAGDRLGRFERPRRRLRAGLVLLRARALLTRLLNAAPSQRQPSVAGRLRRAEERAAGNFPVIWRDATGGDP